MLDEETALDEDPPETSVPELEGEASVSELEDGKVSPLPPPPSEEQEKVNAKASIKPAAKRMDFALFMIYLLTEG
jgi:hypothetical protein